MLPLIPSPPEIHFFNRFPVNYNPDYHVVFLGRVISYNSALGTVFEAHLNGKLFE